MSEQEMVLTVDSVALGAVGVKVLTLAGTTELPAWEAGAHIDLVLSPGLVRQYSLCGDPGDRTSYRIGVLLEEQGRGGSQQIHDKLEPGDEIQVRGPRNHFGLEAADEYLFVAGGIGVTPLIPMIASAEATGARWTLTYGGRSRSSMAFLDELKAYGDRVQVVPADEHGLLDLRRVLGTPSPGRMVYCCGPEGLVEAVEQHCAPWPSGLLHTERFAPKAPVDHTSGTDDFEVVFERSGSSAVVHPGESILDVATSLGIDIISSCEEGTCGTCETPVISGVPDHRDSVLDEEEQQAGECMMVCVSRSCSPRLVLDL